MSVLDVFNEGAMATLRFTISVAPLFQSCKDKPAAKRLFGANEEEAKMKHSATVFCNLHHHPGRVKIAVEEISPSFQEDASEKKE